MYPAIIANLIPDLNNHGLSSLSRSSGFSVRFRVELQYCCDLIDHLQEPGKRRLGDWYHQSRSHAKLQLVAVDRFGAVNVVSGLHEECSTGSCAPVLECNSFKRYDQSAYLDGALIGDDSIQISESVPVSCTGQSTSDAVGPPVKQFCSRPNQDGHSAHVVRALYNDQSEVRGVSCRRTTLSKPRHSADPTRIRFSRKYSASAYTMDSAESSGSGRHSSEGSTEQINRVRFDYKFASDGLEAILLERMETRQKLQDETPEPERCSHVISPEDLIWGSLKHYIGMVFDRETNALLGTAVLFIPPDQPRQAPTSAKSAWVTSIQAVEGRTEVLIKNCRGVVHAASLLLTSTATGVALFSVNVWQGTFALAFLSRMSGPAYLPHRLFVDVERSDRVYVIGYEEPWESESASIADARVRPGRIVDAGRHGVVEIDFTTGQLGGSIASPGGFRGGLVVRADGLVAGVVCGELLPAHRTDIDFSYAYNIYALLEEL